MMSSKSESGFTLVEVLVALVAGAMLLSSVSWVVAGLSKDMKAVERLSEPHQTLQSIQLLDQILSSARYVDTNGKSTTRSSDVLGFEMQAPAALGQSGYVPAQLKVINSAGRKALLLELPGTNIADAIVLSDLQTVSFKYEIGTNKPDPNPDVRRIVVNFLEAGANKAQIVSIRPRLNLVGSCVFDPITQRCSS